MAELSLKPNISVDSFKEAMRYLAGAVTIVATQGHGITATAVCSVSAEPPSILVCANKENHFADLVQKNNFFSINVLHSAQIDLSNVFAGSLDIPYPRRFDYGNWRESANGCPIETDALLSLECVLEKMIDYATHQIIVGRIVDSHIGQGSPLLYFNRNYRKL